MKKNQKVEYLFTKAAKYQESGKLLKARDAYQKIIKLQPLNSMAYLLLGCVLHDLGQSKFGLKYVDHAIKLDDQCFGYHYNRGLICKDMGNIQLAIEAYEKSISLNPSYPQAYNNLGNCWLTLGKYDKAIYTYQKAYSLDNNYVEPLINLGLAQYRQSNDKAAVNYYEQALTLAPNSAAANHAIGRYYLKQKDFSLAEKFCKIAHQFDPNHADIIMTLHQIYTKTCQWTDTKKLEQQIFDITARQISQHTQTSVSPFAALGLPWTAAMQQQVARSHSKQISGNMQMLFAHEFKQPNHVNERLRIGYISADFREHTVGRLIQGIFAEHDRKKFEIYAYATRIDEDSAIYQTIRDTADHFISLSNIEYDKAAQMIYADNIDILVDLTGFTENSRLEILARRPAKIQMQYLGYLGTLGADFIDYIITDKIVTPPEMQAVYDETFLYLPGCHQVNSQAEEITMTVNRAQYNLPNDAVVLCCFNNHYKIDQEIVDTWIRILKLTDNTVLWLLAESSQSEENLMTYFKNSGIHPDRLVFAQVVPIQEHLARTQLADIYLDTSLVNARTSASDALKQGVPMVTCQGNNFGNRIGSSLLTALGLEALIAQCPEEYIQIVLGLITNPQKLATIKAQLDRNIQTHDLYDTKAFTQKLENRYLAVMQKHVQDNYTSIQHSVS